MGFMWQGRRGSGYIWGIHHCPPHITYCNNENNFVHFLGHLNSTGRPPLTKSWDYRCAICTASFCCAGDQTRTFMHARQAHYQLSYYLTPKEFFSDNILHFLKGQVELKMLLADWACKRFCSSATLIEKRKEERKEGRERVREQGRKEGRMNELGK